MALDPLLPRDATAARHAYRRAATVVPGACDGDWRIEFLGNDRWLELLGRAQRVLGLGKLHGLRFRGADAWHLVGAARRLDAVKPMRCTLGPSVVDGAPTLAMASDPANGRLFELLVRSEVRRIDEDRLLGVDLVGLADAVVPMPFLLLREDAP